MYWPLSTTDGVVFRVSAAARWCTNTVLRSPPVDYDNVSVTIVILIFHCWVIPGALVQTSVDNIPVRKFFPFRLLSTLFRVLFFFLLSLYGRHPLFVVLPTRFRSERHYAANRPPRRLTGTRRSQKVPSVQHYLSIKLQRCAITTRRTRKCRRRKPKAEAKRQTAWKISRWRKCPNT